MWKYIFSSVAGTFHARSSLPVQDACAAEIILDVRGAEVLIAVASDGAGSAIHGQAGSRLACDLFIDRAKANFADGGDCARLAGSFIEEWVVSYQRSIISKCESHDLQMHDFACTLLAAVVEREQVAYFQLGDGAIVTSSRAERGHYRCVCWPQRGEYANTTNFLTDADAAKKVFRESEAGVIDEIAIFTDGIQNLVLDYRGMSAHAPFFAPLFAWLQPCDGGYSRDFSDSLAAYLNSEKINARTDDDKTLILATRREV